MAVVFSPAELALGILVFKRRFTAFPIYTPSDATSLATHLPPVTQGEETIAYRIEGRQQHHELLLGIPGESGTSRENAVTVRAIGSTFKHSVAMIELLRRFVSKLEEQIKVALQDVTIEDWGEVEENGSKRTARITSVFFSRDEFLGAFERFGEEEALLSRLRTALVAFENRLNTYKKRATSGREVERQLDAKRDELRKLLRRWDSLKLPNLYGAMWRDESLLKEAQSSGDQGLQEIATYTTAALSAQCVPFEDAMPLLLLEGFYRGFPSFANIDHAIVDEAQDYSFLDYYYLTRCLPTACTLSIVGDLNQSISPELSIPSYDVLARLYGTRMQRLELSRSYRSTGEINAFADSILGNEPRAESVRRTGERPCLTLLDGAESQLEAIADVLRALQDAGRGLIAVLCRTRSEAEALHRSFGPQFNANLLTGDTTALEKGVHIIPIYLAKGLEFDAVVIPDVSQGVYSGLSDKQLLYTACTRALHELHLFSPGELSPLIRRPELLEVTDLTQRRTHPAPLIETVPSAFPEECEADTSSAVPPEAVSLLAAEEVDVAAGGEQANIAESSSTGQDAEASPAGAGETPGELAATAAPLTVDPTPGTFTDATTSGPAPDIAAPSAILLTFPTVYGGAVEIRFPRRVSLKEFERIRQMLDLSAPALIEEEASR